MKEVMLWNKDKTHSCKASKIREINIYPCHHLDPKGMEAKVLGWYNPNEDFLFGYFTHEGSAKAFVEDLHKQIKEA